jgi:hypothetical protein
MAETLKVVMMTRNLMDPVPVEYNTCILHVLEAYHDLQEQLDARDKEIEELRSGHTRDVQDFENLAERCVSSFQLIILTAPNLVVQMDVERKRLPEGAEEFGGPAVQERRWYGRRIYGADSKCCSWLATRCGYL